MSLSGRNRFCSPVLTHHIQDSPLGRISLEMVSMEERRRRSGLVSPSASPQTLIHCKTVCCEPARRTHARTHTHTQTHAGMRRTRNQTRTHTHTQARTGAQSYRGGGVSFLSSPPRGCRQITEVLIALTSRQIKKSRLSEISFPTGLL